MKTETKEILEQFKALCEDDKVWFAFQIFNRLMDLPDDERAEIEKEAHKAIMREKLQVIKGEKR